MKRKALFVGINDYEDAEIAKLRFAISDATEMYGQFRALGFTAEILNVPASTSRANILNTYRNFTSDLGPGDVFLFYFAGHGYTPTGSSRQLLVARDDVFWTLEDQEGGGGVAYDLLSRSIEKRGCHSIFVLDACRSEIQANNTRGAACPPRDLVPKERLVTDQKHGGTMVALRSCSRRQRAHEVPKLEHGLYTYSLLEVLREHHDRGMPITFDSSLSDAVARKMDETAKDQGIVGPQDPEFMKSSGLDLPCLWLPDSAGRRAPETTVRPKPVPGQSCASLPLYRVIDLTTGEVTPLNAVPTGGWPDEYKTKKLVLRRIDPGTFTMGSPEDEEGRCDNEIQHKVTLTKPYYMGVFEVTQGQWEQVMGYVPLPFKNPMWPVEELYGDIRGRVNGSIWPHSGAVDAESFLGRLRVKSGLPGLDLPTEAQWEYACRAGSSSAYSWGNALNGDRANCDGNYPCGTTQKGTYKHELCDVGSYTPNVWGLYDMHGNVLEWCLDWYEPHLTDETDPKGPAAGECRVYRGGCWCSDARNCRSASRNGGPPSRISFLGVRFRTYEGFRLACSAGPSE